MPSLQRNLDVAESLLEEYVRSTGLIAGPPVRYLWTDAFAVCTYLGLHEATGRPEFLARAIDLVHQVHDTLGRHVHGPRMGAWLSGRGEAEGARHPTAGGLRIGKPRPERAARERFDERAEWDRDGQYLHYLTRWIHALDRVGRCSGEPEYQRWAGELALVAHRAFLAEGDGRPHLHWKMSVDLTRPLVPWTGAHDALDSYVTIATLIHGSAGGLGVVDLESVRSDFQLLCDGGSWVTADPLGAGGLLDLLHRVWHLLDAGRPFDRGLFDRVTSAAVASVDAAVASGFLRGRPSRRLAFRELGLSIGLSAAERLREHVGTRAEVVPASAAQLSPLVERYGSLREEIERVWLDPLHQSGAGWSSHRHISTVMLAASLAPQGYLGG